MTGWYVAGVLFLLLALVSALWHSAVSGANSVREAVSEMSPALTPEPCDYVVSVNDWGPDFEQSDLGRWRWVVWRESREEGSPLSVGNDISGQQAWLSVWSAIVKDYEGVDGFTPRIMVEWKKVRYAEDHA